MPALRVLPLTGAFSGIWPELAESSGLTLEMVSDPASLDGRGDAVALVSAGGEESEMEAVFGQLHGATTEIAAVGTEPSHRMAVGLIRAGAVEYFVLPQEYDLLRSWLLERGERLRGHERRSAFTEEQARKYRFEGILGDSPALRMALERAARIIPHPSVTVLITGETGTGKELLARAIHYNGPRARAPFVDVNCAAIPENLLESELFGHEKGAFTSATAAKPGLFEEANGGTLFLDEIGHMPLALQGKLLRALEERQIRRVGGVRSVRVDVRILAATHVDLGAAVRAGAFREDLYYRLNVVPIELPPLRARREDVIPLVRSFTQRFAAEYGMRLPGLTPAAERLLRGREWPGNIRELRNAVERAMLLATGSVLDEHDFAPGGNGGDAANGGPLPVGAPLVEVIRSVVEQTVESCGGNKSEAARQLRISRTRLLRILENRDTGADDALD